MKNRFALAKGFTLAEVLITLGIIGIVAAITIPGVMQNYKKKAAAGRLKHFYATIIQAIRLSEIDNGPSEGWEKVSFKLEDGTAKDDKTRYDEGYIFLKKYILPYIKYSIISEGGESTYNEEGIKIADDPLILALLDGTQFIPKNGDCMDLHVDLNGEKGPNSFARDRFIFILCPSMEFRNKYFGNENTAFSGKTYFREKTREEKLTGCKNDPTKCSGLIQFDNWEFRKDYPYKL